MVPPERLDQVVKYYTKAYEIGCMIYSRPYPGVCDCLERLSRNGIQIGVITNKRDINAKRMIAGYFPNIPMKFVWGRSEKRLMKPNPESGYEACQFLQLSHREILFVGDGPETDIAYAQNVGFGSAGVSWGYRSRKEMEEAHPDYIADSFQELSTWILSS